MGREDYLHVLHFISSGKFSDYRCSSCINEFLNAVESCFSRKHFLFAFIWSDTDDARNCKAS